MASKSGKVFCIRHCNMLVSDKCECECSRGTESRGKSRQRKRSRVLVGVALQTNGRRCQHSQLTEVGSQVPLHRRAHDSCDGIAPLVFCYLRFDCLQIALFCSELYSQFISSECHFSNQPLLEKLRLLLSLLVMLGARVVLTLLLIDRHRCWLGGDRSRLRSSSFDRCSGRGGDGGQMLAQALDRFHKVVHCQAKFIHYRGEEKEGIEVIESLARSLHWFCAFCRTHPMPRVRLEPE